MVFSASIVFSAYFSILRFINWDSNFIALKIHVDGHVLGPLHHPEVQNIAKVGRGCSK